MDCKKLFILITAALFAALALSACAGVRPPVPVMTTVHIQDNLTADAIGSGLMDRLREEGSTAYQDLVSKILDTAKSQLGKPYCYGGTSPETGFDCSGFVQWTYGRYGFELPRTSRSMLEVGRPVDPDELQPGDLLIYYRGRGRGATHVGIYTGEGQFIHSPRTGDSIKISKAFDKYHKARFAGARRVLTTPVESETKKNPLPGSKPGVEPGPDNKAPPGETAAVNNLPEADEEAGDIIRVKAEKLGITARHLVYDGKLTIAGADSGEREM